MTDDTRTLKSSAVCSLMADVFNALSVAGIDFEDVNCAMAVATLGDVMLGECGAEPHADDVISAKETFAETFIAAVDRKYGG